MVHLTNEQRARLRAAYAKANRINDELQLAMDECDQLMTEFGIEDNFRAGGLSDYARVMVFDEAPEDDDLAYQEADELFKDI